VLSDNSLSENHLVSQVKAANEVNEHLDGGPATTKAGENRADRLVLDKDAIHREHILSFAAMLRLHLIVVADQIFRLCYIFVNLCLVVESQFIVLTVEVFDVSNPGVTQRSVVDYQVQHLLVE
jgi:hypothetical protein